MKKKIFGLLSLITVILTLIACDNKEHIESYTFNGMGTQIEVQIYEKNDQAAEKVEHIFDLYSQLTSNYNRNEVAAGNPYYGLENIYLINQKAGEEAVKVRKELIDVIELGIQLHETTNGYFNIGLGKVSNAWKDFINQNQTTLFPDYSVKKYNQILTEVKSYKEIDLTKIVIDKEESTVFLTDKSFLIDLGAIAKGYATQVAYEYLQTELGLTRFKINAGNSSIAIGLGPKDHQMKTYIGDENGLYDEYKGLSVLGYIKGENHHVATSGTAQQQVDVLNEDGTLYKKVHHLISPFTFEPINNYYKVTLVGDDSGLLDVYATAVFLMDLETATTFLEDKNIGYVFYLMDYSIATNLSDDKFVQYEFKN